LDSTALPGGAIAIPKQPFMLLTNAKFQKQNESMNQWIRVVVLLLTVGLTISSYCAQACSLPQLAAPECPQHPHSGTPNCCEHSSTDAKDATMTFLFMPHPQWISCNLPNPAIVDRPYDRAEAIPPHSILGPSTVLRV
jgi:hypothetical protein